MSGLLKTIGITALLLSLNHCGYHWADQLYQTPADKARLKKFVNNICFSPKRYSSFQRELRLTLDNQHLLAHSPRKSCYQLLVQHESISIPNLNNDSSQSQSFTISINARLSVHKPNQQTLFTQTIQLSRSILVNPGELISGNNRIQHVKKQLYQQAANSFVYHLSSIEVKNDAAHHQHK